MASEPTPLTPAEVERTRHLLEGDATDYPPNAANGMFERHAEECRRARIFVATIDDLTARCEEQRKDLEHNGRCAAKARREATALRGALDRCANVAYYFAETHPHKSLRGQERDDAIGDAIKRLVAGTREHIGGGNRG